MITLGIGGGMGAGKSHVCRRLFDLKVPVFYCDFEVKKILNGGGGIRLKNTLINLFGLDCYTEDGYWNVEHIAKLALADKIILDKISSHIEPYLIEEINAFKKQNKDKVLCAIESALFPKSLSLRNTIDKMVLVTAPLDVRIRRIKDRDPMRSDNDIIILLYNQIAPNIDFDYTLTNGDCEQVEIENQVSMLVRDFGPKIW